MSIKNSIEIELKKPIDFNNLCSICGCNFVNDGHKLPCNHIFHYDCLLKFLQINITNTNKTNECPYCRQKFDYLPLLPGIKPIKFIHSEYKTKQINEIVADDGIKNEIPDYKRCNSIYLSGKNKGKRCNNQAVHFLNNQKYCRHHIFSNIPFV
jgi:hypothetical protein